MTREEAIKELQESLDTLREYDIAHSSRLKQALEMAIQALSQEPTDDATLKDIFCMGCECKEQEPCTDTVSIRKDILKCRVENIVAYNVEWLKKHWQMEMAIVCGVKPCDDAISRDAVDKYIARLLSGYLYDEERERLEKLCAYLWELPSVTQKSGKWIEKDFRKEEYVLVGKCSVCGQVRIKDKFCSNCGADMREEQTE